MFRPLIYSFIVFFFPIAEIVAAEKENVPPVISMRPLAVNELDTLNELIASTQHTLQGQLRLKEQIVKYQDLQQRSLNDDENYELLYAWAKTAHVILEMIKEQHLLQMFDSAFINELNIVSKPASKRGIPKP